jgi:hypothetical protein
MPCATNHSGDRFRVGGDDEPVAHAQLGDTADNPEDEGVTCQRQEGLLR